jgi:preprotein translocase subunit SecG
MEAIKIICWMVQITSAIGIIVLVLLQHGKGADAGATFGSGGSGSLFGASGASNFLSRTTAIFAAVFFITTFSLVLLSSNNKLHTDSGIMAGFSNNATATGATASTKTTSSATSSAPNAASVGQKQQKQNEIPE